MNHTSAFSKKGKKEKRKRKDMRKKDIIKPSNKRNKYYITLITSAFSTFTEGAFPALL